MTNTIPEWMYPSECRTLSRKYGSDRLWVAMNCTDAAKPVLSRWDHEDEDGWTHTGLQTADFRHRLTYQVVAAVYRAQG